MKRVHRNLAARDKGGKQGKFLIEAQATLEETVQQWEAAYGEVKID
jgi:hypothetical protein